MNVYAGMPYAILMKIRKTNGRCVVCTVYCVAEREKNRLHANANTLRQIIDGNLLHHARFDHKFLIFGFWHIHR